MKILLCFGTRPEAIKMATLYRKLQQSNFEVKVCVTAQHRQMLDQVLDFFEIIPEYDLDLMQPNQTLNGLSANILTSIDHVLNTEKPDLVLVHGDTTTSTMMALAAFHLGIKVGHIEAGLRTYKKLSPFPEEMNRQITSKIANYHFTPTNTATQNLLDEGVASKAIIETGNTVIDALFWTIDKIEKENYKHQEIEELKKLFLPNKKLILVTGHRRENFGVGIKNLCEALLQISKRDDVIIIYPVHLNPNIKEVVYDLLSKQKNIILISPVSYPAFVWLMKQSFIIITDSGGIQEEAPSLGKPVIVTRTVSERPEGIIAGFSTLVGTDSAKIIKTVEDLLNNFAGFKNSNNPYGNGNASQQIVDYLLKNLK
jgi:UDP-N-acetylglucosamine 2-epimerase (non-hydrolysing)